jgi:pimeloyl-ACP methyl ester carboxylesterase
MKLTAHAAHVVDCDIHYLEAGASTHPTVVNVHGGGGLRMDEVVFAGLAEHYRLLLPSMPGFDVSTAGSIVSTRDAADVMAEFIRRVAGGRATVIGESFGGKAAAWLAARHPEVVDRLVLASPDGLREEGDSSTILSGLSPKEIRVLLFGRPPEQPPTVEQVVAANHNRMNVLRLNSGQPPFDQDLYAALGDIKAPTLILWGTEDRAIPPQNARFFTERIRNARLVYLERAPHVAMAAVPEPFLTAILEFLSATQPASTS